MTGAQVDRLCLDWLKENRGPEMARQYTVYALLVPRWNSPELNEALDTLRLSLCIACGPDESFGDTDYRDARRRLGLPEEAFPIPEAFLRAFEGRHF